MTARVSRVQQRLRDGNPGLYLSVFPPDNQYLSGILTSFEEISSILLIGETTAFFLCDSRYTEQAQAEVRGFEIREIKGDPLRAAGEIAGEFDSRVIAYDPATITVDELDRFQAGLSARHPDTELQAIKGVVSASRERKEPDEIERIREANDLAETVLADLRPEIREGVTEQELAARFEYEFKRRGATGASFDTIALFGARSSLPHGIPSDRPLQKGDVVLLDFGCRRGGYCSDLTRTYVCDTMPGPWFEEIYELTLRAQRAALEAVRPGARCQEVDGVARRIIAEGGFGERFGHGLGHGVGIEIHEAPRLNPHSEAVLEPGMVVTIEPGIYLPQQGGVRIEDLVAVTDDGCEVLSRSPKELTVIGG